MKTLMPLALVLILWSGSWAQEPVLAPRPYTAREIRDFYPVGTVTRYATWDGRQIQRTRSTVVEADETSVVFEDQPVDENGNSIGEAKRWKATWEELRDHASFPRQATTITDTRHRVTAGLFDCWLYEVKTDTGKRTFYFAKEKPGAPIMFETWEDGALKSQSLLERLEIPGRAFEEPFEQR